VSDVKRAYNATPETVSDRFEGCLENKDCKKNAQQSHSSILPTCFTSSFEPLSDLHLNIPV